MGAAEPAITIVGASIPALRVLLTDFKHFTQRRASDQSESQGSNFDFWDDGSRQSRRSLFKWDIFGSSKSIDPSNATGATSTITCSDTTTLAPPVGLAANFWASDSAESPPGLNCEMLGTCGPGRNGDSTPKTSESLSVPTPTRPAPSRNYPNLSQQLEDFLWSRKNSYAGTLSESIYDGDSTPVVHTVSKQDNKARAIKQRSLGQKTHFTSAVKVASKDDRDTWSLSSVIECGTGGKGPLVLNGGGPGQFVVVQTTEITVEFE